MQTLKAGDNTQKFTLLDQDGEELNLHVYLGSNVLGSL